MNSNPEHEGKIDERRVMVLGYRGYLGSYFRTLFPGALTPDLDITNAGAIRSLFDTHRPAVLINCAGRCGTPNVDWCEDHKLETVHSNVLGPLVLLEECARQNVYLVHMSSGCIYTGDKDGNGFSEEDPPNFTGSFYSRSKAWADQILREFPVLVLRLRMPFDDSTNERNLIMKLRRYRRVLVEKNSLTHLPEFLEAAARLIARRATGIFNIVNPGLLSPHELMELYREIVDPHHTFEPLTIDQLGEVVRAGRSNCALSTDRLQREGIQLRPVRQAAEYALERLARRLRRG